MYIKFKEILLIILIIALIMTLVVLFILISYVLKLIKLSTKLKAKQLTKFNEFANTGEIVFLGDSLTEFYPLEEFFHGLPIYNRGIASDTTEGVISRLVDNVILIHPKAIFLQIGTNDYSNKKSNYEIFNDIKKIILKSQENKIKVYVISLYPINAKAKIYSPFFTRPRKNKKIKELNNHLQEYCTLNNIEFINVYDNLTDNNGNLDKNYTVEGLHLNFEGYKVVTKILLPYITKETKS